MHWSRLVIGIYASHEPAATITLTHCRNPCLSPNIARSASSEGEASAGARALAGAVLFLDRRQSWCTPSLLAAETSLYSCSPERFGKKVRFQAIRSKPASPRTLCDRWHQSSSKRSVGPSTVTEIAPSLAFNRVCARTAGPTWNISPSLETTVTDAAAQACDGPAGALSRPSVRQRKHIVVRSAGGGRGPKCWRTTASAGCAACVAHARAQVMSCLDPWLVCYHPSVRQQTQWGRQPRVNVLPGVISGEYPPAAQKRVTRGGRCLNNLFALRPAPLNASRRGLRDGTTHHKLR